MAIEELLKFFEEDVGKGDITTDATIPEEIRVEADVVAKESGTVAGLEECAELLDYFALKYKLLVKDGRKILRGQKILEISGEARMILTLERLLLDILMSMSGTATATATLAEKCKKYGVTVAGTRKTTPGFRYFEKKAIKRGGGKPHRLRLDDFFLIKDNHIAIVGLEEAIKRVKDRGLSKKIEVEVSSAEDALKAAKLGADVIMLDNMKPGEIKKVISRLKEERLRKKIKIELSGGINEKNIESFAKLKPDIISVGALTTGAKWIDMSLEVRKSG